LTNNIFILQATTLGQEPSPMELFVEMHMWSDDRQKRMQRLIDNRAQHFVVCWFSTIFFLKLLFTWIWWFYFFYFQGTYNNRLNERYGNDLSTQSDSDPDLWLKAGLSSGPHRNWVYELSNTMTKNLRMTCGVSTVGCSQSVPST
jgi:hypothetical protein